MKDLRIAVVPGDGIGVEVIKEACGAIEAVAAGSGKKAVLTPFDWSAEAYLKTGVSLPKDGLKMLADNFDAILLGAMGDPRVPDNRHAADILLGLRFKLDLYINLRPVKLLADSLTPLKGRTCADVDFVVFRENTEGLYTFMGGIFKKGTPDEVAIQEEVNTRKGVERIIEAAFEFAERAGRKKVTLADKSNAMTYGHDLWRRAFREVADRHPSIQTNAQYIDATAMFMVLDPGQFDVIVTNNLFGDIITDLGAALQGGLGVAGSGNIHPGKVSLFEPVHGSAPQFAGKNIANPIGSVLAAGLMLEHLGQQAAADAVERAVVAAIGDGKITKDVGGSLSTTEAGAAIAERVRA